MYQSVLGVRYTDPVLSVCNRNCRKQVRLLNEWISQYISSNLSSQPNLHLLHSNQVVSLKVKCQNLILKQNSWITRELIEDSPKYLLHNFLVIIMRWSNCRNLLLMEKE